MQKIIIIMLAFFSIPTLAQSFKCEIKDSINPPDWPKEYIHGEMGLNVSSLDFIHKIPNDDGTFKDSVENLYAGLNRGGYKVTNCNPNENEYIEAIGKINLYSMCIYGPDANKIIFEARLSFKQDGSIKITLLPLDGDPIERSIHVSVCQ